MLKHSSLRAAVAAILGLYTQPTRSLHDPFNLPRAPSIHSRSKRYPQMVTSSAAEIATWNAACVTRQVLRHRARHA